VDQQLQKRVAREIIVERINRGGMPEKMRFGFDPETEGEPENVDAGVLKRAFLDGFREIESDLENESESDENHSFHLVGFDGNGVPADFRDDEEVDLQTYTRFEISPRTTGGSANGPVWKHPAPLSMCRVSLLLGPGVRQGIEPWN
jgi:hypothetical protein